MHKMQLHKMEFSTNAIMQDIKIVFGYITDNSLYSSNS